MAFCKRRLFVILNYLHQQDFVLISGDKPCLARFVEKMIRLLTLLCALSLVVSCGQPGKLYLPDEPQALNAPVPLPVTDSLSETLFT